MFVRELNPFTKLAALFKIGLNIRQIDFLHLFIFL